MQFATTPEEIHYLVDKLTFKQKVERSLGLISDAYDEYGDGLVVANSLGKDSCVVWDLAKRVSPEHPRLHRHHALQAAGDQAVHAGDRREVSRDAGLPRATPMSPTTSTRPTRTAAASC